MRKRESVLPRNLWIYAQASQGRPRKPLTISSDRARSWNEHQELMRRTRATPKYPIRNTNNSSGSKPAQKSTWLGTTKQYREIMVQKLENINSQWKKVWNHSRQPWNLVTRRYFQKKSLWGEKSINPCREPIEGIVNTKCDHFARTPCNFRVYQFKHLSRSLSFFQNKEAKECAWQMQSRFMIPGLIYGERGETIEEVRDRPSQQVLHLYFLLHHWKQEGAMLNRMRSHNPPGWNCFALFFRVPLNIHMAHIRHRPSPIKTWNQAKIQIGNTGICYCWSRVWQNGISAAGNLG